MAHQVGDGLLVHAAVEQRGHEVVAQGVKVVFLGEADGLVDLPQPLGEGIGVDELPVEVGDMKVSFPWFAGTPTPEEVKAYDHFICALCEMARNQKRITAKERDTGNDKYAFRCFLLRLGFIGPEFKQERKILLRNLTGSSAFKLVPQKEVADDAASE